MGRSTRFNETATRKSSASWPISWSIRPWEATSRHCGKSVTGLDGKPAQAVEMSGEVAPRFVIHAPEVIHDSEEWQKKYAPKTVLTDTKNESEEA